MHLHCKANSHADERWCVARLLLWRIPGSLRRARRGQHHTNDDNDDDDDYDDNDDVNDDDDYNDDVNKRQHKNN